MTLSSPPPPSTGRHHRSLAATLVITGVCRLVLNTARRFAYPFAPEISRGLGVPITHVTAMITVNQLSGLLGLLAGPWADRFGLRSAMLAGLALLAIGMLAAGIGGAYGMVLAALFLAGLGKTVFDPAIQAYVGNHVPYRRRGLVIGIIEMSWAGSTLVGIPVVGFIIAAYGWRQPFLLMGILGLIGMAAIRVGVPEDHRPRSRSAGAGALVHAWRQLAHQRSARMLILLGFLISMANDGVFVIMGAWLERQFDLSVTQIGLGSIVIGLAELSGEVLTMALADRLGKKRAILGGLLVGTGVYAVLPFTGNALGWALAGLFCIFLTVEFTIVTTFSLATEVLPRQRATMMAGLLAAAGMGRMAGALTGGWLWVTGGLTAVALNAAILSALAWIVVAWGLRGRRDS